MEIIKINPKKKNIGIVGYAKEHNYTQLHILIDKRIEDCNSYDVDFKMSNEEVFTLKDLKTTEDGYIIVPLEDTVLVEGNLEIQPIGHQDEAIVKSCVYNAKVAKSVNALQKELEELNPSVAEELYKNTIRVVDELPKNPKVGDIVALRKAIKSENGETEEEEEEQIDYWKDAVLNGPDTGLYIYNENGEIVNVNIDSLIYNDGPCQFSPNKDIKLDYGEIKTPKIGCIAIGDFFGVRYIVYVFSGQFIVDEKIEDYFRLDIRKQFSDGSFDTKSLGFSNYSIFSDKPQFFNIWYINNNGEYNIPNDEDFQTFSTLWEEKWLIADVFELFLSRVLEEEEYDFVNSPEYCIDIIKQFCFINNQNSEQEEEDNDKFEKTLYIAEKKNNKIVWKKYLSSNGGASYDDNEIIRVVEELPDVAEDNTVVAFIDKREKTIDDVHIWGLDDEGFITYEKDPENSSEDSEEYPVVNIDLTTPEERIIFNKPPTGLEGFSGVVYESAVGILINYDSNPVLFGCSMACNPDDEDYNKPICILTKHYVNEEKNIDIEYIYEGQKFIDDTVASESGWYYNYRNNDDNRIIKKVTEADLIRDFYFDWTNATVIDMLGALITKQTKEEFENVGMLECLSPKYAWNYLKQFLSIGDSQVLGSNNLYIAENTNGKTSWKEFLSLNNKNIKAVDAVEKLPTPQKIGETIELLEPSPIKIDEVKYSDLDCYNGTLLGGYDASYDIELNIKDQLLNIEEQEDKFFYSAVFATEDNLEENSYIGMNNNFCIVLCSNFADFNFSEDLDEIKKPFIDILLGNENDITFLTYRKEVPKDYEEQFNFNGEGWYYQDDETGKMEKISDPINRKITNCFSFDYGKVVELEYGFGNFGDLDNVKEEIDTFLKIYKSPGLYTVKEKENKKEWQSFVTLDYVNKFIKNDSKIIKSYTEFPIYEYNEDSYDSEEIIIHTNSSNNDYVKTYYLDVLIRTDPRLEFNEEGHIIGFKNSITAQSGVEINGLPAIIDLQYLPQNYYGGITFGTLEMGMEARFFVWIKSGIIDGEDIGTALYINDRATKAYYAYAKENALVNEIRVDEEGWYIANHSENGKLLKCTEEQLKNFVIKEEVVATLDYMTYFDKEDYDNLSSQENLELDYDHALRIMSGFIKFTKRPQGLYKKHKQACWEPLLQIDETLTYKNGKLSVNTTNEVSEDNTLPITSAAVQMQIGNIEELLKTI